MLNLNRLVSLTVVSFFLVSVLLPTSISTDDELPWWDERWSFREEIILPVYTSSKNAHYQPVDIYFEFEDICWAKNESEHSVRVIFQERDKAIELDCQIYDLNFSDSEHIKSCGIVFLIPEFASGNEKYFIYYDDEREDIPSYDDHVDIDESSYFYEPIPGLSFESWFYIIIEDGYYVYAVSQRGKSREDYISQQVLKLKKGTDNVMPNKAEQTASFSFVYWWYKNNKWNRISTAQRLISKQIITNGNLMVKFVIVSQSNDGLLQSTNYYKYYYSPTDDKGIYIDVEHKVIGYPLPQGDEIDVGFAVLNMGGFHSSSIEDLNFGQIPKYLHFYHDEKGLFTHEMDQYPENTDWQEIIGKQDDYDIGNFSWLSIDDGDKGEAYGVIFDSNDVLESGTDERNGIELQLHQAHEIRLPGLDGRFSNIYIMRNAYEEGEELDNIIPDDYIIKFRALFFAAEEGGYTEVEEQAKMYQSLIDLQPKNNGDIVDGDDDDKEYTLTVFTHLTQFLNLRLLSSRLLLKNSYIIVELYQGNILKGFATSDRLALTEDYRFDWGNISFFKSAIFTLLKPGEYVAEVYLENALFSDNREFIGYEIVNISKDTEIHIFCKPERKISITYLDQEEKYVENVTIFVIIDNVIISKTFSDSDGKTNIGLPAGFNEMYTFRSVYKGFLIDEEQIKLGIINSLIPLKKTVSFNVYDLTINIKDSEDKTPDFDVDISLTSDEMQNPVVLKPDDVTNGVYHFYNLYPANYKMKIKYNSAEIIENINLQKTISKNISFHNYTLNLTDSWGLPPEAALEIFLTSLDFEKTIVFNCKSFSAGEFVFSDLYPGKYTLTISYKSYVLEKNITVPNGGNSKDTIVFSMVFNLKANVFDSHGIPLRNARVVLSRGDIHTQGFSDDNGKLKFVVPPGVYTTKVYSDGVPVAQRNVDVLNDKEYDVVTIVEPVNPFLVIIIAVIILGASAFICCRRKDSLFFIKVLAIFIAIVALVTPWWTINGELSNSHLETSTNMYLMPSKMVTITSDTDVITGEISSLTEDFNSVINLIPMLIIFSVILILLTVILRNVLRKRKLSFVVFILSVIIFVGCLFVFYYTMSELAKVTVGSFIGNGNIDVNIYADNIFESIPCSWGPGIGFYLFIASLIILIFGIFVTFRKKQT